MPYKSNFSTGIRPDPYMDLVEWANTRMRLTKESSVEPGQYRTDRTPYVEEILRELSPQSPTDFVVVKKPTQFGFTTLGNIFLFAIADLYPGPAMLVQPTDDMAKKHSKKKIAPSVAAIPTLRGKIKKAKSRDSGNTLLLKEFPGGSWTLTGSNSPTSARSDSVRYLLLDDYDGFVLEAGDEGDTGGLFINRTDAFGDKKKIYINSTPTLAGVSRIDIEYESSSQGKFNVPCPHCGRMQYMEWSGVKFTRDDDGQPVDVWYECRECKARIDEHHKTNMLKMGRYIHKFPDRKKRGFHINALYSPIGWLSWRQIVEEFLEANKKAKTGDTAKLKRWVNCRLAETFEEKGERPQWATIKARAEAYTVLTVPMGGRVLCAGVDTQDNRLEITLAAFGPGEEMWIIYHGAIYGDPDQPNVWKELDGLLERTYPHESGGELSIISCGIDSQGHRTQAVYNYCRRRAPRVFALQGASRPGKPVLNTPSKVDVDFLGRKIPNGVELWTIGTDTAKTTIYSRLGVTEPGPGCIHTPIGLDDNYYRQLTAEKLQRKFVKGFPRYEWVKIYERNEALDCVVYAYAAALKAGITRIAWEKIKIAPISKSPVKPKPARPTRPPSPQRGARPGGYRRPAWMG